MNIEEVIATCRRKRFKVDAINLAVGTLMVDGTGVVARGSGVTALADGTAPALQPDDVILAAAQTFTIHPEAGKRSILDREEFEQYLR